MERAEYEYIEAKITFDIAAIRFTIYGMLKDLGWTPRDAYKISSYDNILIDTVSKIEEFESFKPVLNNLQKQKDKLFLHRLKGGEIEF